MTNMLCESAFFGVVISLLAYELGMLLKKNLGFRFQSAANFHCSRHCIPCCFSISIIRIIMTVQNT